MYNNQTKRHFRTDLAVFFILLLSLPAACGADSGKTSPAATPLPPQPTSAENRNPAPSLPAAKEFSPTHYASPAGIAANEAERLDAEIAGKLQRLVLIPLHEAVLSAETSGKVEAIHFQLGSAFQKGDELITMDDLFFLATREKARSALKAAGVTLQALTDLRRRNDASIMELENAQRDLSAAKAEMALAERNFSACHVRAPYSGRVAEVYVNEHELVEAGHPLLKIIEDGTLLGHIFLPGHLYARLHTGQKVPVEFPDAGLGTIGEINRIAPAIDPASDMFEVYLKIDNRAGKLRSGLTGWVATENLDVR